MAYSFPQTIHVPVMGIIVHEDVQTLLKQGQNVAIHFIGETKIAFVDSFGRVQYAWQDYAGHQSTFTVNLTTEKFDPRYAVPTPLPYKRVPLNPEAPVFKPANYVAPTTSENSGSASTKEDSTDSPTSNISVPVDLGEPIKRSQSAPPVVSFLDDEIIEQKDALLPQAPDSASGTTSDPLEVFFQPPDDASATLLSTIRDNAIRHEQCQSGSISASSRTLSQHMVQPDETLNLESPRSEEPQRESVFVMAQAKPGSLESQEVSDNHDCSTLATTEDAADTANPANVTNVGSTQEATHLSNIASSQHDAEDVGNKGSDDDVEMTVNEQDSSSSVEDIEIYRAPTPSAHGSETTTSDESYIDGQAQSTWGVRLPTQPNPPARQPGEVRKVLHKLRDSIRLARMSEDLENIVQRTEAIEHNHAVPRWQRQSGTHRTSKPAIPKAGKLQDSKVLRVGGSRRTRNKRKGSSQCAKASSTPMQNISSELVEDVEDAMINPTGMILGEVEEGESGPGPIVEDASESETE